MYHIYADGRDVCQTTDKEVAHSVEELLSKRDGVEVTFVRVEIAF